MTRDDWRKFLPPMTDEEQRVFDQAMAEQDQRFADAATNDLVPRDAAEVSESTSLVPRKTADVIEVESRDVPNLTGARRLDVDGA